MEQQRERCQASEGVRGAFGRTAGWWFCGCESLYRKNQPQWKLKPLRSLTHHAHSPVLAASSLARSHPLQPVLTSLSKGSNYVYIYIYIYSVVPFAISRARLHLILLLGPELALNAARGTVPLSSETKLPRNSFANRCRCAPA